MSHLVANDRIVAEVFDGETVLIDVEKGLYFSLQGAAMELWQAFAAPQPVEPLLAAALAQAPQADLAGLRDVVERMQAHELLLPAPAAPAPADAPAFGAGLAAAASFEVFTDLAELIAIDPVHEVDAAAGWPLRPPSFPDVA